ncbi:hypothetical protein ACJ72_08601, partial [Emergomyces africanus]
DKGRLESGRGVVAVFQTAIGCVPWVGFNVQPVKRDPGWPSEAQNSKFETR